MLGWTLSKRWISCRIATELACAVVGCLYGEVDDPRRVLIVANIADTPTPIRSRHAPARKISVNYPPPFTALVMYSRLAIRIIILENKRRYTFAHIVLTTAPQELRQDTAVRSVGPNCYLLINTQRCNG